MSAPDTNIDKQKKRHRGPLIGFAVAGLFVAAILAWYLFTLAGKATDPEGSDVLIDGRTGDAEVVDPAATPVEPVPAD